MIYVLRNGTIDPTNFDERRDGYFYLFTDGVFIKKSRVNKDGVHFDDPTLAKSAQKAGVGRLDKTIEALGLGGQA